MCKVFVVTVVGIAEDLAMMTMGIGGLPSDHLIAADVITPPSDHHMVEGQEGIGQGPILLTVVLKGTMLVALDETWYQVLVSVYGENCFIDFFRLFSW